MGSYTERFKEIKAMVMPTPIFEEIAPPKRQRSFHRTGGYGRGRVVLHRRKPFNPSGVALASPKSNLGAAQRGLDKIKNH